MRARTPQFSPLLATVLTTGKKQRNAYVHQTRTNPTLSDSPFDLILAALQSVPVLTGTEEHGFNFTLYTGDLVSHDPERELSR